MDFLKTVRNRRSVRTFDGTPLTGEHREQISQFLGSVTNPYGIPVRIRLLDKAQYGLSSPVITGETLYAAAKVPAVPHSEEAFGYAFEQLVLYAQSLGIGTTWIGGTMKRDAFEKAMQLADGERMYCVTPLGYPAEKMSLKETAMRTAVQAEKRRPAKELFFSQDFSAPLTGCTGRIRNALVAVRFAPSAVNRQPWRIVQCGSAFHFYEKHSRGYAGEKGDIQKVDMGIALYHFMRVAGGTLTIADPGLPAPDGTEYIATVML